MRRSTTTTAVAVAVSLVGLAIPGSATTQVVDTINGYPADQFIFGGAPVGSAEMESNCRPKMSVEDMGNRERSAYLQCLGFDIPLRDEATVTCEYVVAAFAYIEAYHPNHPSPERVKWSAIKDGPFPYFYRVAVGSWRKEFDRGKPVTNFGVVIDYEDGGACGSYPDVPARWRP